MTLRKILFTVTIIIFFLALAGSWIISTHHFQVYLQTSVQNQTLNTANTLALSLSKLDSPDSVEAETMVNAVFETGDYQGISLINKNHQIRFNRMNPSLQQDVPGWFKHLYPLTAHPVSAWVTQGWTQTAILTVLPNLSHAYVQLWRSSEECLLWFLVLLSLTLCLEYLALHFILKPLDQIKNQAIQLTKHEFIFIEKLPRIQELHHLAHVMNTVIKKMQHTFEEQSKLIQELRKHAFQDTLTDLGNRRYFNRHTEDLLSQKELPFMGGLCLIEFEPLEALKSHLPFHVIETYLIKTATIMQEKTAHLSTAITAKLSDHTFAIVLPMQRTAEIEAFSLDFKQALETILANSGIHFNMGISIYKPGDTRINLMKAADQALVLAKTFPHLPYGLVNPNPLPEAAAPDPTIFTTLFQYNLEHNTDTLLFQPVMALSSDDDTQRISSIETLFRLKTQTGDFMSAGQFIALADNYHLTESIDKRVIEKIQSWIIEKNIALPIAINLSMNSLLDPEFKIWLKNHLSATLIQQPIIFEIEERKINGHLEALWTFMDDFHAQGCLFGLDDFGSGLHSIDYVQRLPLTYVKLAGSLIQDIEHNIEEQFYLRSLTEAIKNLDIQVIAKGVERAGQQATLIKFGILQQQGYFYQPPCAYEALKTG